MSVFGRGGGGYWIHSQENPFNRMDYTRGGGGLDNKQTWLSNKLRAEAMKGSALGVLPRYRNLATAAKQMEGPGLAFINGQLGYVGRAVAGPAVARKTTGTTPKGDPVVPTTGPGAQGAGTALVVPGPGGPRREYAPDFGVGAGTIGVPGSMGEEPVMIGDFPMFPDERFPYVEDWWDPRYGEVGEMVGGALNMVVDAVGPNRNLERYLEQEAAASVKIREGSVADWLIKNSGNIMTKQPLENYVPGLRDFRQSVQDWLTPRATLESELPSPMQYRPMAAW